MPLAFDCSFAWSCVWPSLLYSLYIHRWPHACTRRRSLQAPWRGPGAPLTSSTVGAEIAWLWREQMIWCLFSATCRYTIYMLTYTCIENKTVALFTVTAFFSVEGVQFVLCSSLYTCVLPLICGRQVVLRGAWRVASRPIILVRTIPADRPWLLLETARLNSSGSTPCSCRIRCCQENAAAGG